MKPTLDTDTTDADRDSLSPGYLADRLNADVSSIRCVDVTKRYGRVEALGGVTFDAQPGELHCIAGPNGSGKTTLGRVAAGLTRATRGTVEAPHAEIGLSFQTPRFYPRLSTRENLAVFARVAGGRADDPWTRALATALRLDRVAHQPADELSGGFKRKLDLALTALETPAYLWLDEPLGDLDETSRQRVLGLLESYVAAGGGVVVSTHDLEAFDGLATRLSVMLDGEKLVTEDVADGRRPLPRVVERILERSQDD